MNKTKICMAVLATASMGWMPAAMADPVIGFDPCGTGGAGGGACFFHYASVWTNRTDSGIDVGAQTAPSFHTFHSQTVVAAFTNNGVITTPLGMNNVANQTFLNPLGVPTFELSKTIAITDLLFSVTGIVGVTPVTFNFTHIPNPASPPQLTIFFDTLSTATGDASQAVPQGPAGAKCYGPNGVAGVTTGGAVGCAADGIPILTAHLIANVSSFTAVSPGVGTGSFDLLFEVTDFDPAYLDLSNLPVNGGTGNPLIGERITGTLTQPFAGFPTPAQMWDGTKNFAPGVFTQLFKVDSSQSFVSEIPEPASLLLLGLGLLGLGAVSRRRTA